MGWPMLAFGSGAAIVISNLHRCGLMQRARHHALAKRDLEFVVLAAGSAGERDLGDLRGERVVELLAFQQGFGLACPPRDRGHAAERDPGIPDRPVLYIECDSRRRQREFVGLAITHLDISRTRPASLDREGGNQLAW